MTDELSPVIGLEVHMQLDTDSKLFCSCSTDIEDAEPNVLTCPVCLGHPGTLPQPNEEALEKAIIATRGINGKVADKARFDRKHYFYPDLPKGFQITQNEEPICTDGQIETNDKVIDFQRAHIEEDPGSMTYDGSDIQRAEHTKIDYNRSGVPLMEFVTAPQIESPEQARQVVEELIDLMDYMEVIDRSDSSAVRVDANISLDGEDGGTSRAEVKNIGSPSEVEDALAYEVVRQKNTVKRGKEQVETTRHWDESGGVTRELRTKESAEDYRYMREFDIPKIETF